VLERCAPAKGCAASQCLAPCEAAQVNKSSVGCEYLAVQMDFAIEDFDPQKACFVAFVANTWPAAAHLTVEHDGASVDLAAHARIPQGAGKALAYGAYDPAAGLPPGEVAILMLAGGAGACPATPARPMTPVVGTSRSAAFRIRSDVPVVAYQMLPYGGGSAAVTGATLLLPTSAWDTNYIAANAYAYSQVSKTPPTMTIVATEDATKVTLLPKVAIAAGAGVDAAAANAPVTYALAAGEALHIVQKEELTGSPLLADKPVGVFAGHRCLTVPVNVPTCDHAEQQIPPVRALGSRYAAVSHRERSTHPESPRWRLVGAVDGTVLSYDPPTVAGPVGLERGEVVEIATAQPFVVASQDADHPFLFVGYMTSSGAVEPGYGDPDFVRVTAVDQYLGRYVFFTDPTYPETNLVVVRRKGENGFADVTLDCAGKLGGWATLGAGELQYTRLDLVRFDFEPQGGCDNGRHEMSSTEPFGLWVWGWGTPETTVFTADVSYGYPAGENVAPINQVLVPPTPQ
jgi:hypothetical protein